MPPNNDIERTLLPGTILKSANCSYKIEATLGHGTFGITYKAKIVDGRIKDKIVSIKEFFVDGVSSRDESGIVSSCSDTISIAQCKAEFVAEAKNLILLNHPNIVKAYEVFETNGTVYYSMEYIEGENLNSYLAKAHPTTEEAVGIITKIAYGLSYMHESRHMLHLDLKPGNVMRRASDGQIILIDFGLSRYYTENELPDTTSPVGLGTRGYAPVEQTEFKRRKKDFKATIDVYALGATFYKLITGETPPPSDELMAHPDLLHRKLSTLNLSEKNIRIIEKAMSPSPDNRYPSVMSFIYDINAEERQRRKKGCLLTFVTIVGILACLYVGNMWVQKHRVAKQEYYKSLDGYAFQLSELNNGNHDGQEEYYKFFSNGTGFYMIKSWNEYEILSNYFKEDADTMTFKYDVVDHSKIVFEKGLKSSWGKGKTSVFIDLYNKEIVVDENDYPLSVDGSINWDEIKKMLE